MKTIAQIAEEIGVSKQAVHQKIKKEPLSMTLRQFTSTVDGALMIDIDGEKLIKSAFNKIKQASIPNKSIDDVKDQLIQALQLQIDNLTVQNAELMEQLKLERVHSREQNDRIANLAEQLARINENSQVLLRERNLKDLPQIPEKTSFWGRFKRKNKE